MPRPPVATPSPTDGRRDLGRRGEEAAARWYARAGYEIVARNWRCPVGELDLVAVGPAGAIVVFCEVKTRSSLVFGTPAEAVTPAKQQRIRRLAARWLSEQRSPQSPRRRRPFDVAPPFDVAVRFDVAAVMDDRFRGLVVDVVQDAF